MKSNCLLFVAALIFSIQACTPPDNKTQEESEKLKSSRWEAIRYPIDVTLNFNTDLDKVSGNSGCNRYNADFEVKNYDIEFSAFVQTKKACENMDLEREYLVALSSVVRFQLLSNGNLVLQDRVGRALITFRPVN